MARRRSVARFVRPPARSSVWIGLSTNVTIVGGSAQLIGVFNAGALALRPFTIVRSRGIAHLFSDQAAVSESPRLFWGGMVVSDQASAAGVGSIPDPGTNTDAPWFIHEAASVNFTFLSSVGVDANGGSQYLFDSKSMRKVGQNEDLALVTSELSGFGAFFRVMGRMLVKLH